MPLLLRSAFLFLAALSLLSSGSAGASDEISLAGRWRFALDPDDAGDGEEWFARSLPDSIDLPGTTDLGAKGHALDEASMTYPEDMEYSTFPGLAKAVHVDRRGFLVRENYYLGRAWYQRDFDVLPALEGKHWTLLLERVLWESRVWIDGRFAGSCDSLAAPHRYDLGLLPPGAHTLTLCVDNRMIHNTGTIGHAYGPETQSRWNGVVGRIGLSATEPVFVRRIDVFTEKSRRSIRVRTVLANTLDSAAEGRIDVSARDSDNLRRADGRPIVFRVPRGESSFESAIALEEPWPAWDEFSQALHRVEVQVTAAGGEHRLTETFGFREYLREGQHISINGRRVFLRGTLDCCVYPRTGHPPVTAEEWHDVLGTIKAYGFNHVRYHSWCPPEAAFTAADRLGIYLAPETGFWVDGWTTKTFSHPAPLGHDDEVLTFVRREMQRISEEYGNHPSFAFFCIGNEFAEPGTDWDAVDALLTEAKKRDPRRLYNASTARKRIASDDYFVHHAARGVGPAHTDWDFTKRLPAHDLPVIAHETGQRPVFPDYDRLLPQFTGPLKPHNYERLRREAAAAGLLDRAKAFEKASARFQLVQYKAEHEAIRRTPGYAGYQLLMLNDFTGQSEALVGILDPFWQPKGEACRAEVLQWNAPTVVLARFSKYLWGSDEILGAAIEVAHHGPRDLAAATAEWSLATCGGGLIAGGTLGPREVPTGRLTRFGEVEVSLTELAEAVALELTVTVNESSNRWNLWAYPSAEADPGSGDLLVVRSLDREALAALKNGERVLLLAHGLQNAHTARTGYLSVYWSAGWWGNEFSSLGIVCDPAHGALRSFPTDAHSDWQWQPLCEGATTFLLEGAPRGFRPIVQLVTDFHHNRLLAQLFEARVGEGRLLVCGYDLETDLETRHSARQFRQGLIHYARSDEFRPAQSLSFDRVEELLAPPVMERLGARVVASDSHNKGNEPRLVLDGDARTIWHTQWEGGAPGFPHELTIGFAEPLALTGVALLPRQDGNRNGWIREYELYVSADGESWSGPVARGVFEETAEKKKVNVPRTMTVRFVKLRALSGFDNQPFASLAELEVLVERSP